MDGHACWAFIKELNMKILQSMANGLIQSVMKAWKLLRKGILRRAPTSSLEWNPNFRDANGSMLGQSTGLLWADTDKTWRIASRWNLDVNRRSFFMQLLQKKTF